MPSTNRFGRHYLIELIGCDPERIKFVPAVREVFLNAAIKSRATVLEQYYHQFEPFGVSGVLFIAESHFSIHTWPEDGYAGVDILTCGDMDPELAIADMKAGFAAKECVVKTFRRGMTIQEETP